jgi:hypothetical protein
MLLGTLCSWKRSPVKNGAFLGADHSWQQIIFRSRLFAETVGFLEQRDFGKVCF